MLALLLGGCATAAENELARMKTATTDTMGRVEKCRAGIEQSAEWQELSPYLPPLDGSEPSMTLRTNNNVPTDGQAATLIRLFNDHLKPCQALIVSNMQAVHSAIAALFTESFAARNEAYAKLAGRQVTWGAYANFSAALLAETKSALARVGQQITSGLQAQHNAEMSRRQTAFANAYNIYATQTLLNQNQQAINAMYRPSTTNCQFVAGFLQCRSY